MLVLLVALIILIIVLLIVVLIILLVVAVVRGGGLLLLTVDLQVRKDGDDIVTLGEGVQDREHLKELSVGGVIEPADNWQSIFRLENVRVRGVVNDYTVGEFSPKLGKILDVIAIVLHACLTEEALVNPAMRVEDIQQGISILGQTCGEDNHFKLLSNGLQELIHAWSLENVHMVNFSLEFDGQYKVSVRNRLEGAVDKGFIQVQHESLFVLLIGRKVGKQVLPRTLRHCVLLFRVVLCGRRR